ncbi:helix-turn-helix domain-containing protein [Amphibacillus sediminis]|uniref:helix-turn-helix domain-containing protein n=1 Tax=Amphibacillus sediminis TaxID=360185 RepID=UPI0008317ED7|nr:helix-turn-helix transcriptional regulator [Amphibacillus sediminis]
MEECKQYPKAVSIEFGNLIKQRREELGYTIKKVASAVHSSESYISRIECHKRMNPSVCIVYRLAEVLEIDFVYLLEVAFPQNS